MDKYSVGIKIDSIIERYVRLEGKQEDNEFKADRKSCFIKDLYHFLLYLGYTDGKYSIKEVEFINSMLGKNETGTKMKRYVHEFYIYSEKFEKTAPVFLQFCYKFDNVPGTGYGYTLSTSVLDFYRILGEAFINSENYLIKEKTDNLNIYMKQMEDYLKEKQETTNKKLQETINASKKRETAKCAVENIKSNKEDHKQEGAKRMGLLGSLFKISGKVMGNVAEGTSKIAGGVIGVVADELGAPEVAKASRDIGNGVGEISNSFLSETGKIAGTIVDKAIDITTAVGGGVGEFIAESCGASNEEINKARTVGKIVGGAAGGLLVGDVIGAGITGVTVATGVASTGTAISALNGAAQTSATLAQIGGGTIAAGGGGMAAGQAILTGINVASTIGGATDATKKDK